VNRILATRLRRAIQKIHEGFDREYGVDTAATVSVSALGAHGRNVQHAVEYQAILPEAFAEVMKQLPIDFGQSVFIDFGSGKGRALLLASEFPFEKIVGVEFSPQLHGIAEANCRKYRSATQKCKTIELLCIDAVEYDIPPKPAVFYFYNPFHEEVMTQIAGKVDRSLRELPRKVFVVYFWAFWAERRRSLEGIEGLEPFPVCQPLWPGQSGREVVKVWVTKRNVCAPGESRKIEREIRR
jgi:SAM-dependent methyltransferase